MRTFRSTKAFPYFYLSNNFLIMSFLSRFSLFLFVVCSSNFNLLKAQIGLAFDGSDDYVQTNFEGPKGKQARSVECWVKPPNVSRGIQMFVDYGTNSQGQGFGIGMNDGYLSAHLGSYNRTTNSLVGDLKWHHVALTYDSTKTYNFRIYLDGDMVDSFTTSFNINTGSSVKLKMGSGISSGNTFAGILDEVRVWNHARSLSELKLNGKDEFCQRQKGLLAYYKLNEGISEGKNPKAKTAKDYGKGGKDGVLNNFYLDKNVSNWVKGYGFNVGYTSSSISDTACGSYRSPSRKFKWTKSGNYTDTIPNVMGCDSAITIALKILNIPQKKLNINACNSYTSPSGDYVWTQSGTYSDKLKNPKGCDTTVIVNLTIEEPSSASIQVKACAFYTSPSGKNTWNNSGNYTDTISNAKGCDSVITIDLTIQNSFADKKQTACGSMLSPSGKYKWTTSGKYIDTITNIRGCDSIITFDLNILANSTNTISVNDCKDYISPSGKYIYKISGNYSDTLSNSIGCDSIIEIAYNRLQPKTSISQKACNEYVSPSGDYIWQKSGLYTDTLKTNGGCDSIITVDLEILESTTNTISPASCISYSSPSGKYLWTKSGLYTDTLNNKKGCDSIIEIDLTITHVETGVSIDSKVLTAKLENATYQWYDCINESPIENETSRSFAPKVDGDYAVIVSSEACTDTSECINVSNVSIGASKTFLSRSVIYPNPTVNTVEIVFAKNSNFSKIVVTDIQGKVVKEVLVGQVRTMQLELPELDGVYIIKLISDDKWENHRVMKIK